MRIPFYHKKQYIASGSLSKMALHRFGKNKMAMMAFSFILLSLLVAILGYWITPDKTPFANNQNLELKTKKPFFKVQMLQVALNRPVKTHNPLYRMLFGQANSSENVPIFSCQIVGDSIYFEEYTGLVPNEGLMRKLHLVDVVFSLQNEYDILKVGNEFRFLAMDGSLHAITYSDLIKRVDKHIVWKHYYLGTDRFGRDYLSQLIIGTRVSLSVGFIAVLISLVVGISLGAVAAYFGKWVDQLIVWFINVVWSIPTLLLVIAINMAIGKGYWQVFIAVGLTMWVEVARVVRGQVLSIRQKEYVEAGTALGFTNARIIFRHILPNVLSPLIVISAANFASAILIEAGLSFLGIGVQPPTPSWGIMIKEHYAYLILDYAYLAILPGLAIMLMVLAFMIVGNGLRDALDVKLVKE